MMSLQMSILQVMGLPMKVTRGSSEVVAKTYSWWNSSTCENAGLEIIEMCAYLAYAPEIAVMLQRQQASAIIDARKMIVDGLLEWIWNGAKNA